MNATNSYELLKDIEKKLGIKYEHRYDVEPYSYQRDKSYRAKFALVYKGTFGFGNKTLLVSNELDLEDSVHGIDGIQEYLSDVPRYNGKLLVETRRTKLGEGWWTLYWVDYFTNVDGQEDAIKKTVAESKLSPKDKEELEKMLLQKENKEIVGWIPPVSESKAWAFATALAEEALGMNDAVFPKRMDEYLRANVYGQDGAELDQMVAINRLMALADRPRIRPEEFSAPLLDEMYAYYKWLYKL